MTEVSSKKPSMLDKGGRSIVALMVALLVAIFAFQLNASMLSPALATMTRELKTTDSQIALTQTVFFTAAALFSLFLPRLADLVGRKKVLTGILISTILGCAVSAIAPNVTVLMIGRILQGASGPVVPMCLIMLRVRVSEEKRYAKLMAILTSVNGGIAGVDALLGGWLAGNFGFRSVFWTMAAIGIIAVLLVAFYAEESHAQDTPKMDWVGVVTLGIAFLAAYLAINEIGKLAGAGESCSRSCGSCSSILCSVLERRGQKLCSSCFYKIYESASHLGLAFLHASYYDWRICNYERRCSTASSRC